MRRGLLILAKRCTLVSGGAPANVQAQRRTVFARLFSSKHLDMNSIWNCTFETGGTFLRLIKLDLTRPIVQGELGEALVAQGFIIGEARGRVSREDSKLASLLKMFRVFMSLHPMWANPEELTQELDLTFYGFRKSRQI